MTHGSELNDGTLHEAEERPPLFPSWRRWYIAILAELVILIVLFRLITVIFE